MARRRGLLILLSILGLFLLGTVVVLSSITYYLSIDPSAYLTELEVPNNGPARSNSTQERIPRIIHQTWKTDIIPPKWKDISQGCRDMMPDYEYMLWSDARSREFIAEHYPWFLNTWDGYTYNIQRADAIRYFILYHYGGVYIDLDIGCKRPMDQLLTSSVILPKTIPVGVSNDLMFAEKNHPFLAQTIHNLIPFDHSWVLNYPTVMFSTGPMFLSIQYALFNPPAKLDIRILPKALYGKNAKEGEAPHTFFSHYYGSSWHADDAAFIGFLGHWGKILMWIGLVVLIVGAIRMMFPAGGKSRRYMSRYGGTVLLPWLTQRRNGSWSLRWSPPDHSPESTDSGESDSQTDDHVSVLLPINVRSASPSSAEFPRSSSSVRDAAIRVRNRLASLIGLHPYDPLPRTPVRPRRRRSSRGVLFFMPAISASAPPSAARTSEFGQWLPEKEGLHGDLEQSGYCASDEDNMDSAPHSPLIDPPQTSHTRT